MTIPTIEELLQPHLERLRRAAEAKRGDTVKRVTIEARCGRVALSPDGKYRACIDVNDVKTYMGWGNTIDEAIQRAVAEVPAFPDLSQIVGYGEAV